MLVIEHGILPRLKDESQFTWYSYDPYLSKPGVDEVQSVTVHPWHREYKDGEVSHEVAIEVREGDDTEDDTGGETGDESRSMILIVDRSEFVSGLLAVFPELQRNEEQAYALGA